jgi:hypothetical protein
VSGPTGSPLSLCQLSIKDVRKFLGFCTFSGTRPSFPSKELQNNPQNPQNKGLATSM